MTTKPKPKTKQKTKQRPWPASRANIWTQCPASEKKGVQQSAKNYFAEADSFLKDNSILHELVAHEFDNNIELSIAAKQLQLSDDADALHLVNKAIETVELMGDSGSNPGVMIVEKQFSNNTFLAIPDMIQISHEHKTINIFDFKFGYNPVEAENNLQLLIGLHLFLETKTSKIFDIKDYTINGIIIQPTLNIIEMTEIYYDETFFDTLKDSVKKSFYKTGYHCRYCRAKTTCKKLRESVESFLRPLPVQDLKNRKQVWAELLQIAPAVKSLAEELQKEAKNFLSIGGDLPGWTLGRKPLRRMWVPGLEAEFLSKELKIPLKDITVKKQKSPAQIEKVLKTKKIDKSILNDFIVQPMGETLVKNS